MSLDLMVVFNQFAYTAFTETIAQYIRLFNEASRGTISLVPGASQGDYTETAFYKQIDQLVKRRNVYGSGAITAKDIEQLLDTTVKVAAGTYPVNMPPSTWSWIQRDAGEAGSVYGRQLAEASLADMLNTIILCGYAALSGVPDIVYDGSASTLTPIALSKGARLFGDASSKITTWLVHSSPMHDFYENNLANVERLFRYETINVNADPFGRVFIVTDSPALEEIDGVEPNINLYHNIGLTPGAFNVIQNNDFYSNVEETNGGENIQRTQQSEWTFNTSINGFAWDKVNGGKSPNDAALGMSTNWDRYSTSVKNLGGVIVESR